MTSRSRKKRPTIARTYNQAKRLSLALLLAASTVSALAQSPSPFPSQQYQANGADNRAGVVALRPVPREGARTANRPAQTNPQREGWNLRWRRSANAPQQTRPDGCVRRKACDVIISFDVCVTARPICKWPPTSRTFDLWLKPLGSPIHSKRMRPTPTSGNPS